MLRGRVRRGSGGGHDGERAVNVYAVDQECRATLLSLLGGMRNHFVAEVVQREEDRGQLTWMKFARVMAWHHHEVDMS